MTRVNLEELLEKFAEESTGRDNRQPFAGGTRMPTLDSKSAANRLHNESTSNAEIGPAPNMGETDKTGINTLHSQAVKMPSPIGSLPKLGSAMNDRLRDDPLVQYLKKHAAIIEDNLSKMPLGEEEFEMQSEPPDFSNSQAEEKIKEQDDLLRELFTNYPTEKPRL
jgi:hypothetical protein